MDMPVHNGSYGLARYDSMCRAIAAAHEVDEVKDIRDKTRALEAYFRQAKNTEAERRACEIRLRAERRAGQLLARREKAKGSAGPGRGKAGAPAGPAFNDSETLSELGISKKQSSQWQQLAQVPEEEFESALADIKRPSTAGIIKTTKVKERVDPMNPKALWLWGRLRDFEREGILETLQDDLLTEMTEAMRADVRRLSVLVAAWLSEV